MFVAFSDGFVCGSSPRVPPVRAAPRLYRLVAVGDKEKGGLILESARLFLIDSTLSLFFGVVVAGVSGEIRAGRVVDTPRFA